MFKHGKMFDLYAIMITFSVIIVFYALFVSTANVDLFRNDNFQFANKNFKYVNKNNQTVKVSDPMNMPSSLNIKGKKYTLTYELAESYDEGSCFVLHTRHQILHVYVDGIEKPIYQFEIPKNSMFRTPGVGYHFIEIKPEYYGKTIDFEFEAVYEKFAGELNEIYIGDPKDITIHIIIKDAIAFICGLLLLSLGVFLVILWGVLLFRKMGHELLYIGFFSMQMGVFSMCETGVVQLFFNRPLLLRIIEFETLMIVSIPIVLYFRELRGKRFRIWYNLNVFLIGTLAVVQNVIQILGIKDLAETIVLSYVSIVSTFIICTAVNIVSIFTDKRNQNNKVSATIMDVAAAILASSLIVDIYNYYVRWYNDGAMFTRIGFLIFVVFMGTQTLSDIYEMMYKGKKAQMLKEIAHKDKLTKAKSRTAYTEDMNRIIRNAIPGKNYAIVSVDLNDLKIMNDTYGHEAGDRYLKDCVKVISESFYGFGECYRTGGDEFMIIISEFELKKFNERIKIMKNTLIQLQEETKRNMSMSYGYAVFDEEMDDDIYETAKRADKLMYKAKKEAKIGRTKL